MSKTRVGGKPTDRPLGDLALSLAISVLVACGACSKSASPFGGAADDKDAVAGGQTVEKPVEDPSTPGPDHASVVSSNRFQGGAETAAKTPDAHGARLEPEASQAADLALPEIDTTVRDLFVEMNLFLREKQFVKARGTLEKITVLDLSPKEKEAAELFRKRIDDGIKKGASPSR